MSERKFSLWETFLRLLGVDEETRKNKKLKKKLIELSKVLPSVGLKRIAEILETTPDHLYPTQVIATIQLNADKVYPQHWVGQENPFLLYKFPPGKTFRTDAAGKPAVVGLIVSLYNAAGPAPLGSYGLEQVIVGCYERSGLIDQLAACTMVNIACAFADHMIPLGRVKATVVEVPSDVKYGDETCCYLQVNFLNFPGYLMGNIDESSKRWRVSTATISFHESK